MSDELLREYLRDAFHSGALDLGRDRKFLEGFVRIFAGEMEAVIAVSQALYLEKSEALRLAKLAYTKPHVMQEYLTWRDRVLGGRS